MMRHLINLVESATLYEAKLVDGFLTGPSAKELIALATDKDLRGVAHNGVVYLCPAYDETHVGIRNRLGLPNSMAEQNWGFDFYCWNTEKDEVSESDESDRNEWVSEFDEPVFLVGPIGISVCVEEDDVLANQQFLRMLGKLS